jgi:hypothetical protein
MYGLRLARDRVFFDHRATVYGLHTQLSLAASIGKMKCSYNGDFHGLGLVRLGQSNPE